jgi:hypothetical protein
MKFLNYSLVLLSIFSSCAPPSIENVTISDNYTMYFDYYAEVFSGIDYDAYWPELEVNNLSNSEATVIFSYSFKVCGIKQTATGLNRTVTYYAPKGMSYWEMDYDNSMIIRSDARCSGSLVMVEDVDFSWTILSVS